MATQKIDYEYSKTADLVTHADLNLIKKVVNHNADESSSSKKFTDVINLTTGNNTVVHDLGVAPIDIKFFDSTGVPFQMEWYRNPASLTGSVIIVSDGNYSNVEINIL